VKRYGEVEALRGVDLAVAPGQALAVLGPNGAGKTTLINLALGLRRPTAGRVRLFGLDPTDRRARSRCGAVLQEVGVSGLLTVGEMVTLFRAYYPAPLPVAEVLARAGLEDRAGVRVAALSAGQRQRLLFALAVCGDPDLLVLDEPTVGLDVQSRRRFLASLRDFAAAGKTIVLTTHYLEEADQVADRVVVIDRGRVVADGPPTAIKARVAARRVSFRTPCALGPDVLAGLPVRDAVRTDHRVTLLTSEPEAVLAALFQRGVAMTDLEVAGATLEEALLALTRRPASEA
jgi:ABC-2 type transport system ATP-binding protein